MAKKKEEQVVKESNKELEATTIAEVKEDKGTNPIGTIIFFIIIFAAIIALPYTDDIKALITGKDKHESAKVTETEEPTNNEEEEEDAKYYDINNTNVTIDNIKFSKFSKNAGTDPTLNFLLEPLNGSTINLSKFNFYIELYNSGQMLLERVKIYGSSSLTNPTNMSYKIKTDTFNNAELIKIIDFSVDDYPSVVLKSDGDNNQTLTCIDGNKKMTYTFNDQKLTKLNEMTTYAKSTDIATNATLLEQRNNEVNNLNNKDGFNSALTESETNIVVNTNVNLDDAKNADINNKLYYYLKDTKANIVKFELESMRFTCN